MSVLQTWWNKGGCLLFQKSEMGDTDTEAVRTHWADTLFRRKIKELTTDLADDRQLLLSQKYVMVIRVK